MKKSILLFVIASITYQANAQKLFDKINKAIKKDSTKNILGGIKTNPSKTGSLSNTDIIAGLKDALRVATDSSVKTLNLADGYFKNEAIKLLMPAEAVKVEKSLRSLGAGALVDKAILSMNRAAEDAASGAGEIFLSSIKQMTVTDGLTILRGSNTAATEYLKNTTTATLTERMRPVIEASLQKVNATQYWKDVFSKYNMFSREKVNTDLTAYVTGKALEGMFYSIALKEQSIRKDPAAQVTDILKKVFGK
jgi:hypothetical protein